MAAFVRRLGAVGAALLLAALPGVAASPDPATLRVLPEETARARVLVRRLGSDIFRERDDATRELGAMGRRALVALDEARSDPDPEVSARVGQLHPRATRDEMTARAAAFLADADGKYEHDIPAWPKFRAALGDGPAGRELLTELLADRANLDVLIQLGGASAALTPGLTALAGGSAAVRLEAAPPVGLHRALAARKQLLQAAMNPLPTVRATGVVPKLPTPAEFALVLLAESFAPEVESPPDGTQFATAQHFYAQGVKQAIDGGQKFAPALRQLTWRWLESRPGPRGPSTAVGLGLFLQLDPNRLAGLAARTLRQRSGIPHDSAQAVAAVAQAKGVEHLAALTAAFTDERPLFSQANLGGFDVHVCDFALATAVQLTGQRPEDYGFGVQNLPKPGARPSHMTYFFKTDAKQTAGQKSRAAFEKWRAFEAGQLGSVLGGPLADRVTTARFPDRAAKPDPKPLVLPNDD